jgi:GTPase SAR1 family protein
MIGDSAVGKTCLINRYSDDVFNKNWMMTIGMDFVIKKKIFTFTMKIYLFYYMKIKRK